MNKTDTFFKAKIDSLYDSVERDAYPKFTAFLDEHQIALAEQVLHHKNGYCYWGGFAEADRRMLGIYPDYVQREELSFPIAILKIAYPKNQTLTHRDVLGALMSLQLKREAIGDILLGEDTVELAVSDHLSTFIQEQLLKIGRIGVQVTQTDVISLAQESRLQPLEGTVSSLRLDSMVAFVTRLSRSKAVLLLQAGRVSVNHVEATESDLQLKPGDTFTVRGYGKYLFPEPPRMTKKMRCYVTIYQYI